MVWCCGIMTASHGWRLLNTFYMYEMNLVRVWRGRGVAIISYSMSPVRNHDKILRPSPPLLEWWYGMVLWHYDCQPWLKAFTHFLCVWNESGKSMKWILDLTLSWWCDLYPGRGTRPTHGGDVLLRLRRDNEPICLFTAIECDWIPSIYLI
jgi:hypothetical protein